MKDEDLEIVTGCAAVHPDQRGGQHVTMACTGIRITHKPTGISVLCVDERSQYRNRIVALAELTELLAKAGKLD